MTAAAEPLLRAPPFPWADASVSFAESVTAPAGRTGLRALFEQIRTARVGGRFWGDPARLAAPPSAILRPRGDADVAALRERLDPAEAAGALWIGRPSLVPTAENWRGEVDPWSAIEGAGRLFAHGDDEWIAIARVIGVPVTLLSAGRFGAPGDNDNAIDARVVQALTAQRWRDPFTGGAATIEATIDLLAEWRRILDANRPIRTACGMAWWKREEIRRFLWAPGRSLHMVARPAKALAKGGAVAIWPSRVSPGLIAAARAQDVPLVRVEDGFVRSVGLGSGLVPPSSVVVDTSGIHFDPSGPSDLERILAETDFTPRLIARAAALRETIVTAGISKYAAGAGTPPPPRQPGRRLILVPGQVEDDMSVLAGGGGMCSNLELLRRARALEPAAEIWFRPHPDVDAGHRKGAIADADALALADRIVREPAMAALLETVDGVHVLTSLTGFEALLRERAVTCHGTPFYAGWGLTRDLGAVPDRRGRALSLDQLVAGVLILYPRYLDPVTGLPCPPEVLVRRMAEDRAPNRLGWIAPLRRLQGQIVAALR